MPAAGRQTVLDAVVHFPAQIAGLHVPDPEVCAGVLRTADDQVVIVRTPGEVRGGRRMAVQREPNFALERDRIHVPDDDALVLRASG